MAGEHKRAGAISIAMAVVLSTGLIGCGKQARPAMPLATAVSASPPLDVAAIKAENDRLKGEVTSLKQQLEEARVTPDVLLSQVSVALAADKLSDAKTASDTLDKRFADSSQAKTAHQQLSKYRTTLSERETQAKLLEARGFYALQTTNAPKIDDVTLKVESLALADQWSFDAHDDGSLYRPAERGERYLVLRTTVHSVDKSPWLPDVVIYKIDGKKMTKLAALDYRFRRWSSYGTFIGLYHDSGNDFATSASVPFNAGAQITTEDGKQPFAVVSTGKLCHRLGSVIGQPSIQYNRHYECASKDQLTLEDFTKDNYRVLAFFNRPKGA